MMKSINNRIRKDVDRGIKCFGTIISIKFLYG